MKKLLITLNLLFIATIVTSQCVLGDCKNGFGKMQYQDAVYEGNFINGKFTGQGKLTAKNGNFFVGEFIEGKIAKGKFTWANGASYEGDFIDGMKVGFGKEYDKNNKLIYEGSFLNNVYDGTGTYYEDGYKYIGGFKNGRFHGQGKLYDEKGNLKYGEFKEGKYIGQ